jgi:diacylglycerol kinase (ATP)
MRYALRGAYLLIITEASIKVQIVLAIIAIAAGCYFNISLTEWMIQTLTIALVLSVEGMNTALEKLSDYIQPEYNTKIGFIKDIAAGAVLFTAIAALAVGCFIYIPKIF